MTVETLFQWIDQSVDQQIKLNHKREIEDLVGFHLGLSWSDLFFKKNQEISNENINKIKKDLKTLEEGLPLAYIINEKYFYKSLFYVTKDVLIPRGETEVMVELALKIIGKKKTNLLDLGSGSGCIGLSIAKENPLCFVSMIEASKKALEVSKENAKRLKIENCDFTHCEIGVESLEWGEKKQQIDLIVSNPPYIKKGDLRVERRVHDFEPHQALYAEEKGLFWIHKFLLWGYDYLKKDGFFIFEFGQDQEKEIEELVKTMNYKIEDLIKDFSGVNRFFKLKKQEIKNG